MADASETGTNGYSLASGATVDELVYTARHTESEEPISDALEVYVPESLKNKLLKLGEAACEIDAKQ